MADYKRFTIHILGTADSVDSLTLHSDIETALNSIDKCRVKAVNLDMWVDGFTGEPRVFDENGKEIIVKATKEPTTDTVVSEEPSVDTTVSEEPTAENTVSEESVGETIISEEPKVE